MTPKTAENIWDRPKIVSRDEWLVARKKLLAKEKEATRRRDALSAERRQLPMVKIEKDYVFEGPWRPRESARSVWAAPTAHRLPLHVRPGLGRRLQALLTRCRQFRGRRGSSCRARYCLRCYLPRTVR